MSVFRTDSVLLHLRDGDQVFARGGDELFAPGIRSAACRLLEPADTGHSAVEDVVADVRCAALLTSLVLKLHPWLLPGVLPQGCATKSSKA